MKKFFYPFSCQNCFSLITILFFTSQILFSQTWVRKVDGYSMWSIAKDHAGNIYAGTTGSNRGIFKSTDGGETWTNVFSTGASNYLYIACDSLNNVYVANVSNGLIYSTDGGQNFTTVPSSIFGGNNVNSVACGQNGHILVGATNGGIWRSTDYCASFSNTALLGLTIVEIKVDDFDANRIYAGASSSSYGGFYMSTDGGVTFGTATNDVKVWGILQTQSNVLYTVNTSSPYSFDQSTDGGLNWTTLSYLSSAKRGGTLDLIEDIYVSGNGGVFKSTDGGVTFTNFGLTSSSNKIINFDYKIMVCVIGTTNGGVWIYTDSTLIPVELSGFSAIADNGSVKLNWTTATELNNSGFEVQRRRNNEAFEKIAFVPGFGTTTEPKSYSFTDKNVYGSLSYRLKQIDFDGSYELSNLVKVEVEIPFEFSLGQNYPNPFNPATNIVYTLPLESKVRLIVINSLGETIELLVNKTQSEGKYDIVWNAENYPSGVYFYHLQAGSFIEIKKMILLK